jgi:hypothetical protein
LNQQFQTANTTIGYGNWWSTTVNNKGVPFGIANQIYVSEIATPADDLIYWNSANLTVIEEEIDGFAKFMGFSYPYISKSIVNSPLTQSYLTNTIAQVPYTPGVTFYAYTSWEANDPLVHYTTNDLYFLDNGTRSGLISGINNWGNISLPPPAYPPPFLPDIGELSQRFTPWGILGQIIVGVDVNSTNLAYKDPLVWGPDNWNFPTNQPLNFSWIGQVHRGTPWQTIYLKATNILQLVNYLNPTSGLATWEFWTGDSDPNDAAAMAPVQDWQLASLLATTFNTNDLRSLLSVNNPNPNAWQSLFDGLTAWTNDGSGGFSTITISSNSVQASILANAIETARASQPGQTFGNVGTVLSVPELTTTSPWLNLPDATISDEVYEAIPSQLLPLLRTDSFGAAIATNGQTFVQFTGYDGHDYAIETSPDLVHWTAITTNCPVNGVFNFPIAPSMGGDQQFYRSALLH